MRFKDEVWRSVSFDRCQIFVGWQLPVNFDRCRVELWQLPVAKYK